MPSEQEVRTRAGWIGVEISKSRVRTPGKAGYGLYRVPGSMPVLWSIKPGEGIDRSSGQGEPTLWTAYAFTLDEIGAAVNAAIREGVPDRPGSVRLRQAVPFRPESYVPVTVPTRWTSAYAGRRDLGLRQGLVTPEEFRMPEGLSGGPEGLPLSVRSSVARRTAERVAEQLRRQTVNQAFARTFKARREVGLIRRHRAKLARRVLDERGATLESVHLLKSGQWVYSEKQDGAAGNETPPSR